MQPETIEIARSSKVCTVCYRVFQGYKSGAYCCMDCRAVGYNRKRQQRAVEMRTFTFFLLKHLRPVFVATAKDKQTTGLGHVTVQDLKRLKTVYPDQRVLKAFSEMATPLLGRIQKNMEQTTDLNKIRDSLLPKLISGELRVSDAAGFLNENKK